MLDIEVSKIITYIKEHWGASKGCAPLPPLLTSHYSLLTAFYVSRETFQIFLPHRMNFAIMTIEKGTTDKRPAPKFKTDEKSA